MKVITDIAETAEKPMKQLRDRLQRCYACRPESD